MLMDESLWKQMTDRGLLTGLRSQPLPDISTEQVKETLKSGNRVVICWPRSQHNGAPFPNSAVELFHIATVGKVGVVQAINTTFNYVSINVGNHGNAFYGFNAIVPIPEEIKTKPYIDPISQVMFDKMAAMEWVTGSRAKPIPRLTPDVVEGMLSVGDNALVCWPLSPYSGERRHESYLSVDHLGTVGIVGVVDTIDLGIRVVHLRFGNVRVGYGFDSVVPIPDEKTILKTGGDTLLVKDVGQTVAPKKILTFAESAAAFGEPEMYPEGLAPDQLIDQLIEGGYIIVKQFRPLSCLSWREFAGRLNAEQQVFLCYPTKIGGVKPDQAMGQSVAQFVGNVAKIRQVCPGKAETYLIVTVGHENVSWAIQDVIPLPLSSAPAFEKLPPWGSLPEEPRLQGETDGDYVARRKAKYTVRIDLGQVSYDRSGEAYIADFRDWMSTPMISRRRG